MQEQEKRRERERKLDETTDFLVGCGSMGCVALYYLLVIAVIVGLVILIWRAVMS